jgi:hypothetical protein
MKNEELKFRHETNGARLCLKDQSKRAEYEWWLE